MKSENHEYDLEFCDRFRYSHNSRCWIDIFDETYRAEFDNRVSKIYVTLYNGDERIDGESVRESFGANEQKAAELLEEINVEKIIAEYRDDIMNIENGEISYTGPALPETY